MFAEQIARGAALLDERAPTGWRGRIRLVDLDMKDSTCCVVGQTFGVTGSGPYGGERPWAIVLTELGSPPPGPRGFVSPAQMTWQEEHGFNAPADADGFRDYARLTGEWREYLITTTSSEKEDVRDVVDA